MRNLMHGESEIMDDKQIIRNTKTEMDGIKFGKRRICYKDLVNVVRAEKQGIKIDLNLKEESGWNLTN